MNIYGVKGKYRDSIGYCIDVEMNFFACSNDKAEELFNNYITSAPAFEGDWWGCMDEQIKSCTKDITVEEFAGSCFNGKEVNYSIPLVGGEYFVDGCGSWEKVKEDIPNLINDEFRKLVRIYLDTSSDETVLLFMENPCYSQITSNSIRNCISRGVDTFGH